MARMASVVVLCLVVSLCRAGEEAAPTAGGDASKEVAVPGTTVDGDADGAMLPGQKEYAAAIELLNAATSFTGGHEHDGDETIDDTTKAIELLHQSADFGFGAAQSRLGTLYTFGIGVKRSEARATLHYTFAAMAGDVEANVVLAHRYQHGIGVERSCSRAARYAKVAADSVARGFSAQVQPIFDTTNFGSKDYAVQAKKRSAQDQLAMHELQANNGNSQACMVAGFAYMYGLMGAKPDGRAGLDYFNKALRLGEKAAYGALGEIFSQGVPHANPPIERDLETAKKLFARGADGNHPTSLNGLGFMHAVGAMSKDGAKDWDRAFELFKKSADQSNAEGLYNLGVMHLNGRGTPRDVDTARVLFEQARMAGSVLARYQLANMDLFSIGRNAGGCNAALKNFNEVNERGRWRQRQDQAKARYDAGEYGAALLDYLILSEQGVPHALHNAAFLLNRDAYASAMPFLDAQDAPEPRVVLPGTQGAVAKQGAEGAAGDVADAEGDGQELRAEEDEEEPNPRQVVLHALLWRLVRQGHTEAHLTLGDNFYYGRGTQRNFQRAEEHYMLAAQAGSSEGNFNVAQMYEDGTPHTRRDFHLAKRHYDAAVVNDPNAYAAVWLALMRMNARWWWAHFHDKPTATGIVPTGSGAVAPTDSVEPTEVEAAASIDGYLLDGDDRHMLARIGRIVDSFTPEPFGIALDTLLLAVAFLLALVLLHLRHGAAA